MNLVKRWPIHPQPRPGQYLYEWINELANAYEVTLVDFWIQALKATKEELYNVCAKLPHLSLVLLSEGTGVSREEIRARDRYKCFQLWRLDLLSMRRIDGVVCFTKPYSNRKLIALEELPCNEQQLIVDNIPDVGHKQVGSGQSNLDVQH